MQKTKRDNKQEKKVYIHAQAHTLSIKSKTKLNLRKRNSIKEANYKHTHT